MDAETIKDFLISLGFQIDDAGAKKFDSVIVGVTANVFKMAAVVEGAALSVVAFTAKIASGLDNLYWASQRTGATVQGIQQIGYAVSQMGGSVDGARSSLESLSRFMRNSPGAESFLNRLGIQTRDAKGNMRDMASVFTGVGQKLSSMPYYRANQYAQMLGIDENTLMAMRRGLGNFSAQYSQMTKAIGYNADIAAVSANKFMTSLRSFGEMAGMASNKIGSSLAEGLAGSIDNLRKQILENFPKIEDTITRSIKGLLWMAEVIGRVVFRLIQAAGDIREWWKGLDTATQHLIETFGALLVAWRVLNSAFLMSPIGLISALALAIFGLYDDYKSWKEGGKSLIDWEKWKPNIDAALKHIDQLISNVKSLSREVASLFGIDPNTWTAKWDLDNLTHQFGELAKMLNTIGQLLKALEDGRWSDAAALGKQLFTQGSDEPSAMPGIEKNALEMRAKALGFWDDLMQRWNAGGWYNNQQQGDGPEQLAQSVRQPRATKDGAALLGWLSPTLDKLETLYRLPDGLLKSVAITESSGNPNALGPKTKYGQAQGLFQLMPGTAKDLGLRGNDAFDPVKSAQAAAKYLAQLMKMNGGDLEKTLASYNYGIGNVQKYGMALLPKETREYVPKVLSNMPGHTTHKLEQNNTYYIYGGDPKEIGREVGQRQVSANAQVMRTNQNGRG